MHNMLFKIIEFSAKKTEEHYVMKHTKALAYGNTVRVLNLSSQM